MKIKENVVIRIVNMIFGSEASPTFRIQHSALRIPFFFLLTIKFFVLKYTIVEYFYCIIYIKKEVILCTQLPRYF